MIEVQGRFRWAKRSGKGGQLSYLSGRVNGFRREKGLVPAKRGHSDVEGEAAWKSVFLAGVLPVGESGCFRGIVRAAIGWGWVPDRGRGQEPEGGRFLFS